MRRVLLSALAACPVLVLAGCGAHGQPDAMEACKAFSNATSGYQTAAQRDAELADAVRWAGKAAATAPQWQSLAGALRTYRAGVGAGTPAASRRLSGVTALIQNSCDIASRGY